MNDGKVNKEEWGEPSGAGFFNSGTGSVAPMSGRFWLLYDAKFIYFAAQLVP